MMATSDSLKRVRAVSLQAAADALDISKRTLQRHIARGDFPKPIKIGAASRVLVKDIEKYVEKKLHTEAN